MPLVQYVGKKPQKTDNVAHTGLVWTPGEALEVPAEAALKLIQHPDVWRLKEGEKISRKALAEFAKAKPEKPEEDERDPLENFPKVDLNSLDKPGLIAFAMRHLNMELAPNMKEENMRDKITTTLMSRRKFGSPNE